MTLVPVVDTLSCSAHGDTAVVVATGPPDLVMAAAEACPAVAISVIDEATGRRLYP
jgi:hypothetical protein